MEARAYNDRNGPPVGERRRARQFRTRFLKSKSELVPTSNVVEVGPEEFAHLEECMNNPQGPTAALMKGAELIRSLRQKNR
jgi:hypothetical protein